METINTREQLINALQEAAEIEHALLIQYLFAAFSLKRRPDEVGDPIHLELILSWKKIILDVAREEMGHLGLVCNLLSAIGAGPRFERPNFPKSAKQYYPLISDFTLSRFSRDTLFRFVCFEMPYDLKAPKLKRLIDYAQYRDEGNMDPLHYNRVGLLYLKIQQGFECIDEHTLFIGPKHAQDSDTWSEKLDLQLVVDKHSAIQAIQDIIIDGEGTKDNREHSHFMRFWSLWELTGSLDFEPARNVVDNPVVRTHRDADATIPVHLVTNPDTALVANLFNDLYSVMLSMLMQYYSYQGETMVQRNVLRSSLGQMMSGVIRPIAETLTELPLTDHQGDGCAGAGFELNAPITVSPFLENRWPILFERFENIKNQSAVVKRLHPRFERIYQNIEWLIQNLHTTIKTS